MCPRPRSTCCVGVSLFACAWLAVATASAGEDTAIPPELTAVEERYRAEGPEPVLPELRRLLEGYIASQDRRAIAVTQTMIGDCYWRLGRTAEAREHLTEALAASRTIRDRRQEGKVLNLLGLLAWDLGDFSSAIESFTQASEFAREVGDPQLEGAILNNLGLVHDELGDYARARDLYRRALDLHTRSGFARGEGDTLGNIGGLHLLLGQYAEAVDYYQRALEISRSIESLPAQSQDHGNLGYAYTGLGQFDLARRQFEAALHLATRSGMRLEQAYWLRGLANVQIRIGQPDLGLANHHAALDIYREARADGLLVEGLHDLGELMLLLGDPVSAERHFEEAMTLARATGQSRGITLNLIALGDLQFRHRRLEQAEALYRSALRRAEEVGEQVSEAQASLQLARLEIERGDYVAARQWVEGTEKTASLAGSLPLQAEAGLALGDLDRLEMRHDQALERYLALEQVVEGLADPELGWRLDFGRARTLLELGRKPEAVEAMKAAVARIESVGARLQERRFRTGYLQDRHQVYIELARVLIELGQDFDALSVAERLRSLGFVEQAEKEFLPAGDPGQEEFQLRERIRHLQRALQEEQSVPAPERRQAAIESFSRELLLAEQRYQAYLDDRDAAGLRLRAGSDVAAALEALQGRLQPGEAIVEYLVGPDRVMVFVLRREAIRAAHAPVTEQNLRSRVQLLRDLVSRRDSDRWTRPAQLLADGLLAPVADPGWLDDVSRVYLVPHSVLNYVPFAVLPIGRGADAPRLIDRYTLTYLPSALSFDQASQVDSSTLTWLGVAPERSRLRHAPEEALSIGRLFEPRSRVLAGEAATETEFVRVAREFHVLHIATHGHFNRFNPLLSALELEADAINDGMLQVHEILRLRLHSELVTLSACETGLASGFFNEIPAGDDFVGMARAFLQAGSSSVLASLWEVDDRSTVDLMQRFYERWTAAGVTSEPALALAAAQHELKSIAAYRHPYYWAPFVVFGTVGPGSNM